MYQVVYASAASRPFSEPELGALLRASRRSNAAIDVTGMLLYDRGSFLQVLEGDEGSVQRLFEKIKRDRRHSRVSVVLERTLTERQFAGWEMGFVSVMGLDAALPGYSEFLSAGESSVARGSAAERMLSAFRSGRLRSSVEL